MILRQALFAVTALFLTWAQIGNAQSAEVIIAVSANFVHAAEHLKEVYEKNNDDQLKIVSASTGKHVAQITRGAPFDIFLSADDRAPAELVKSGFAVADTEFTYAIGKLALWSADPNLLHDNGEQVLREGNFRKVAYANPQTAPYGVAAEATLRALGLFDAVKDKLVMGESVGQAFSFVVTGNADLGFVALSQAKSEAGRNGSTWTVPAHLYPPMRQNAILLSRAKSNSSATAFLEFLKSEPAQKLIHDAGYETADK